MYWLMSLMGLKFIGCKSIESKIYRVVETGEGSLLGGGIAC